MSSNRTRLATGLLAAGLALAAGACATPVKERNDVAFGVTPTEQYPLETIAKPQGILLAPHDWGLSEPQAAELAKLASNWRDRGEGLVLLEAPTRAGPDAAATAYAARDALERFGVPRDSIEFVGYDTSVSRAPIRVSYLTLGGNVRECSREWADLTKTATNQPTKNFGCAVNSNLAAMIADPADIDRPTGESPADAGRRQVVIDKYRAGTTTSSDADDQANGVVSRAVN